MDGLSHLVEDLDFGEMLIFDAVLDGKCNTLYWVSDVDETSGLTSSSINGHGIIVGNLGTEPVEDSSVVTIDIDSIYKDRIHLSFFSTDSPDDSLMQFGNF